MIKIVDFKDLNLIKYNFFIFIVYFFIFIAHIYDLIDQIINFSLFKDFIIDIKYFINTNLSIDVNF